ncbi:MAG: serine hydrolase domain-containing protein [Dehalococcoidia bacterium]
MLDQQFIASSPAAIGLDAGTLDRIYAFVQRQVDGGLPGAQVAIGRHGQVAAVRSFGSVVAGGREQPTGPEHVFCLYSATKAVAATGVWALLEEGKVRLDQRVCEIIPEFGDLGKDVITLEQVLTFTSGFPLAPMHPRLWEDREARLERMRGWRLNWEPGSRYQYHATPAHWVLMEVIYRCTGLDFREYLRQRILHPMGVPDLFVGLPDEQHHRAADVVYVDPPSNEGTSEANVDTVLHFNLPSQRRAGAPGAGGFSGAGELALFYQRLVSPADSQGFTPLRPETVAMATTVRTRPDQVDEGSGLPANRGLSVVVAGDRPVERGFGATSSPRAFGHGGAGGQLAWGDPESGLSVGFVTNGFVNAERQRERSRTINALAVEALR